MITPATILLLGLAAVLCVIALAATRRPAARVRVERPAEVVYIVSAPRPGLAELSVVIPSRERLN